MSVATTARRGAGATRLQRTPDAVPRSADAEAARREDVPTLEDVLAGVWEDLAVRGRARCVVCDGSLNAVGGGASCSGCGAAID